MSLCTPCTPCPPCDSEYPLLCEPLETTANGKRLVVEDSAACQKTIQTPAAQQVLKTDGASNLTWTNGANNTVLGKSTTGIVEFATINSVLQVGPVDLGSQPLTTTGALTATSITSTGAASVASLASTGVANIGSLVTIGTITATSAVFNVSSSSDAVRITQTGTGQAFVVEDSTNPDSSQFVINNDGNVGIGDSTPSQKLTVTGNIKPSGNIMLSAGQHLALNSDASNRIVRNASVNGMEFFVDNISRMFIADGGNVGIGTFPPSAPATKLDVNGTVRLRGLPIYANNAAAISGGLVADDVYKTSTGDLFIVF
jgi:hypothetical protein